MNTTELETRRLSAASTTKAGSDRSAFAAAAGVLAAMTLVILGLLHVMSPEFDPSWRMVSEYANGRYSWVLSLMFVCWAVSSWLLAYAFWPVARTTFSKLGVVLLVIAGVGEAMAAVFDINHPLHMHAAILGMNGLPIAAMLIGVTFGRMGYWGQSRSIMLWLSNLTWISVMLMSVAMAIFFTTLSAAGVAIDGNSKPLDALPQGVVALGGWANRLLIIVYCVWALAAARCLSSAKAD